MTSIDSSTDDEKMAAQYRVASLAVLGVPVAVVAALTAWLGAPQVLPAVLGAAGWMIALALRTPVALIATRLTTKERVVTIVVAYVMVTALILANLLPKNDPKSMEAKEFLRDQGMMQNNGPAWGVVERFSAAGIHIGFTLLLFAQPWLVLVTIGLHSLTNMLVVRYTKQSIARTQLALLAVASVVLIAGLAAVAPLA